MYLPFQVLSFFISKSGSIASIIELTFDASSLFSDDLSEKKSFFGRLLFSAGFKFTISFASSLLADYLPTILNKRSLNSFLLSMC